VLLSLKREHPDLKPTAEDERSVGSTRKITRDVIREVIRKVIRDGIRDGIR